MSLSRLVAKCRTCPDVDICDHKRMEAYGFLPLPSMSESRAELVRTSTELDIDALTKEIARAVQIPERILRGDYS